MSERRYRIDSKICVKGTDMRVGGEGEREGGESEREQCTRETCEQCREFG